MKKLLFSIMLLTAGQAMGVACAAPALSPAAPATFNNTTTVTFSGGGSCGTPIYQSCSDTTNTCTPTTAGASVSLIALGPTTYLRAITTQSGKTNSSVTSGQYTFVVGNVSCLPAGGTISSPQIVTCSIAATSGATINSCQDATGVCTPNVADSTPTVSATGHLRVQGVKSLYTSDSIVDYTFTMGTPTVGLSAGSIAFGSVTNLVNSSPSSITVTNTGTANLVIGSPSIGGTNSGDFSISSNTCGTVAAAGTCTISVIFNPSSAGTRSGTLSIPSNAASSPDVVTLGGTGLWPAASQCSVAVTFTPAALNARSGTLVFTTNASTSPDTATLTGTGVGPPATVCTPASMNFLSLVPSATTTLSYTVANADAGWKTYVDGVQAGTPSSGTNGTSTVAFSGLATGSHSIALIAIDSVHGSCESAFTVVVTPPPSSVF